MELGIYSLCISTKQEGCVLLSLPAVTSGFFLTLKVTASLRSYRSCQYSFGPPRGSGRHSTENVHTPRVRLDDLFKFLQQLISQWSSPTSRTIKTGTGRIAAYRSRIIVAADNVAAYQSTDRRVTAGLIQ